MPGRATLASTQVEYSLLNRAVEHEVLPAATALGLGRAALVAAGAGCADRQVPHRYAVRLPRRVTRTSRTSSSATSTSAARGIVEAVARAADGLGWTPLEVALVWVRDRPGVTAPIVGARTAAQLKGALGVEELTLPDEIVDALDDVSGD